MRRVLLLLAVACAVTASPASADVPCRNKIYDDWYKDGKIASTYPVACYRDAIKHVKGTDAEVYSSLVDDIRAAMQAAISRGNGAVSVPAQVGKGLPKPPPTNPDDVLVDSSKTTSAETTPADDDTSTVSAAPVGDTNDDGGIPVPLLVLGGLALALAAAGGLGLLARRRGPAA